MARMTREFSLVLLGSGMLAAASFLVPEDDLKEKVEKEEQRQVAGASTSHGSSRSYYRPILYPYSYGRFGGYGGYGGHAGVSGLTSGRVGSGPSRISISRGGFGSTGRSVSISS